MPLALLVLIKNVLGRVCPCGTANNQGNVECLNGPIHPRGLTSCLTAFPNPLPLRFFTPVQMWPSRLLQGGYFRPSFLRHSLHMYVEFLMHSASSSSPAALLYKGTLTGNKTQQHMLLPLLGESYAFKPPKQFSSRLLILAKLWGRKWWNRIMELFTWIVYILWNFSSSLAVFQVESNNFCDHLRPINFSCCVRCVPAVLGLLWLCQRGCYRPLSDPLRHHYACLKYMYISTYERSYI